MRLVAATAGDGVDMATSAPDKASAAAEPDRAYRAETVGGLAYEVPVVASECRAAQIERLFRQDGRLRAVVVSGGTGWGLLSREQLHAQLTGPLGYGRSLHSRSTATDLASPDPLGVIEAAHALGLTVTAEGVERPQQLSILRTLRCDKAQGFLIAPPTTARNLTAPAPRT